MFGVVSQKIFTRTQNNLISNLFHIKNLVYVTLSIFLDSGSFCKFEFAFYLLISLAFLSTPTNVN
jgi:hypothetical protein